MTSVTNSKIGFFSRYYEPFRILKAKVASQNVFKLVHNEDKGTYSFPYLYGDYKNELEPVSISSKLFKSVKQYLDDNLFSVDEKKLLVSELMPYVANFGNDTINSLNNRISLTDDKEEHSQIISEYEKTIKSLKQINEIINNEFVDFFTSLTSETSQQKGYDRIYDDNFLSKSTPIIQKKKLPTSNFPDEVYKDVLKTLSDYGKDIEQKPKVYTGQDEEGLRDHFLTNLTGRYEKTTATGETFNKAGKTDILLKDDMGNNLFIAECKWWKGAGIFHPTINQLFDNYITWRDTKVAIIFFVDNKDFSNVLGQIEDEAKKHQYYVQYLGVKDKSNFSFVFRQKDDVDNNVQVEIMFFHFPL